MARTTTPLEERLGADALIEISRWYFTREKTSKEIAAEKDVHRQAVPRLARAGRELAQQQKAPPGETSEA